MDPAIAAAIIGLPIALVAVVAAEFLRRRGRRVECEVNLEVTRVDFERSTEEFFPCLDITLRNLSATSCILTDAEVSNVSVWEFPPESRPSALEISATYDADLSRKQEVIRMSQSIDPGGVDRFAIRLGTSRPIPPFVGYYLHLFDLSLKVNGSRSVIKLGRYLASIPQPMEIRGLYTPPLTPQKIELLKDRAQQLSERVENGVNIDPVAKQALKELQELPEAEKNI